MQTKTREKYKNFKLLIQVFLLVKITLVMMDHELQVFSNCKYFHMFTVTDKVYAWKSKGFSEESKKVLQLLHQVVVLFQN